jgi:hypothetical protein
LGSLRKEESVSRIECRQEKQDYDPAKQQLAD